MDSISVLWRLRGDRPARSPDPAALTVTLLFTEEGVPTIDRTV
jgi:hypothetical protein